MDSTRSVSNPFRVIATALVLLGTLLVPTPASAATAIQAINPSSGGPGTVVSDKDGGATDAAFHLVARVEGEPSGFVRAVIDDGDADADPDQTVTLSRLGTSDTYASLYDIPSTFQTGTGSITYVDSGSTLSDSVSVTFAHPDGSELTAEAETAEITDPPNGGTVDFFLNAETITGTVSAGVSETDSVTLYVSSSSAGQEPSWQQCGTADVDADFTFAGSCDLATASVARPDVTMVAVQPGAASTVSEDSGDAHRVFPRQLNLTIEEVTQPDGTQSAGYCNTYVVEVLDGDAQPVQDLNIDVHADGPNALRFADNDDEPGIEDDVSDPFEAPDSGHPTFDPTDDLFGDSPQATEDASACDQSDEPDSAPEDHDGTDPDDGQAYHEENPLTDPDPDRKEIHIENVGGTDAAGRFVFSMVLPTTGSDAQVNLEAWVDIDDDDTKDTSEPSGTATKTFEQQTATVVDASPEEALNVPGETHTVSVYVEDQNGNRVQGGEVDFRVTDGPHAGAFIGSCTTASDGTCESPAYRGTGQGTDTIAAFVDSDEDQTPEDGEPVDLVSKTWESTPGEARNVSCEPDFARNAVNSEHTVTCTVTDGFDNPVDGVAVDFALDNGSSGATAVFTSSQTDATDENGEATATISSPTAGTTTVIGSLRPNETECDAVQDGPDPAQDAGKSAGNCDDGAFKEWAVPASLQITPAEDSNYVDQEHMVTAAVTDDSGNPIQGVVVRFSVSGANTASGSGTTDPDGEATFAYTGTEFRDDTITAYADTDRDNTNDATADEPEDTATKTWVPFDLVLTPESATNDVGTSHTVTATVTGQEGTPVDGVTVRFNVIDNSNGEPVGSPPNGSDVTDENGQATFTYSSPTNGEHVIQAYADSDGDGTNDPDGGPEGGDPEPEDSAIKRWRSSTDNDGDGVENGTDNCPDKPNAGQEDRDEDGTGDACDSNTNTVTVEATDADAAEPDNDGTFTFERTDASGELTVTYAISGSATNDEDYQTLDGSVTFADGESTATERVDVVDDSTDEGPEDVTVTVQDGTGYQPGSQAEATVTIADDDDAAPADDDGDGVADDSDNCPATSNPDQADADGDGTGNACDPDYRTEDVDTTDRPDQQQQTGDRVCVTFQAEESDGTPVPGATLVMQVSGANAEENISDGCGVTSQSTESQTTNASGEATFSYVGNDAGNDTVFAFVDRDGDGQWDSGEPFSEPFSITWTSQQTDDAGTTQRLSGDDRWLTAIDISQDAFPAANSVNRVVLARGDSPDGYADALAGAPLAAALDAPLLLTAPGFLVDDVAAEIDRVLANGGQVILLGKEAALSPAVEQAVRALNGGAYSTRRIGGDDRFATSTLIAEEVNPDPDEILIARAFDFPDALTAGAAASADPGRVVVLGFAGGRHATTEAYLSDHASAQRYAIGGQMVAVYPEATPVAGNDRFLTAVEVANEFFTDPPVAGIARSHAFPDSLSGGPYVGSRGGPMLLTPDAAFVAASGEELRDATEAYLCDNSLAIERAYIFGGTTAIASETQTAVGEAIRGEGC